MRPRILDKTRERAGERTAIIVNGFFVFKLAGGTYYRRFERKPTVHTSNTAISKNEQM